MVGLQAQMNLCETAFLARMGRGRQPDRAVFDPALPVGKLAWVVGERAGGEFQIAHRHRLPGPQRAIALGVLAALRQDQLERLHQGP